MLEKDENCIYCGRWDSYRIKLQSTMVDSVFMRWNSNQRWWKLVVLTWNSNQRWGILLSWDETLIHGGESSFHRRKLQSTVGNSVLMRWNSDPRWWKCFKKIETFPRRWKCCKSNEMSDVRWRNTFELVLSVQTF